MKKIIFSLCASVFALQLSACGINSNDDDQQAKANRNEQKLKEMYAPVVGQYVGRIKTAGGPINAKMMLYTDSMQDGYDTNGAPLSHTVLKAQLKLDTIGVLDDHTFVVDYKGFDGSATFTQRTQNAGTGFVTGAQTSGGANPPSSGANPPGENAGCSVGPHDPTLAINSGVFHGDDFSGVLVKQNGTVGALDMHRTSTTAVQPIRDQAERMAAALLPLVGTYGGRFTAAVKPTDPTEVPSDFPVRLDMLISYTVQDDIRCPFLITQYSRPDIFTTGVGVFSLNTDFNQSDSHLVLRSSDTSGPHFASIAATWSPPLLAGDMRWFTYFGTLSAKRCATSAVDVRGECCTSNQTDSRHHCI